MSERILGDDGVKYAVGTLVPDPSRLAAITQPRLQDVMDLLSDDEVMDILDDDDLPLGRDRWGVDYTKNQGPVGKCACSASAGILERCFDLQGIEVPKLSDDYLYCHVNGGSDRGSLLIDVIHQIEIGTCPANFVPAGTIKKSRLSPESHANATYNALETEWCQIKSEQELSTAIALAMPVNVAWHFTNSSPRLDGKGMSTPTRGPGNHSVICDGLKRDGNRFLYDTQNSHGKQFGEQGRCYLGWGEHFASTVNNHVFWALRVIENKTNSPPVL